MKKDGMVQSLIHSIKYKNNKRLAKDLGEALALSISSQAKFSKPDFIIPVPLHPKKRRKRGYNQSSLIALGMNRVWGTKVLDDVLIRVKNTQTQTTKNRIQRWANTREAFKLQNAEQIRNYRILLIDDVLTTGSTLEACANVLGEIKGIKMSIATIAFAP